MSNDNVNSTTVEMKKFRKLEKLKMFIASELELALLKKLLPLHFILKCIKSK